MNESESELQLKKSWYSVNIRSIMSVDGYLIIEGYFDTEGMGSASAGMSPSDIRGRETVVCADGKIIPLPDARHVCDRLNSEGVLVSFRTFEATIDMSKMSEDSEIYFAPAAPDSTGEDRRRIVFAEPESMISPALGCLYKDFGDFALEYEPDKRAIMACRPSASRRIRNETRALRCILNTKMPFSKKLSGLVLRAGYFITRPYFKSMKMRIYYDKIYMGGDNGQYQFMYSFDRCRAEGGPSGRHRYIASRDSAAYYELKRDGYKVHAYESPFRKLIALHADVIFATHANAMGHAGLSYFEKRWCADLFSAHVVCIQHGVAIRDVPQHQARYIDNTELYFCASETEAENLNKTVYGYEPGALRITGLPRFDGLVSDPYPVVLLAPTWRREAAIERGPIGVARGYNPEFKDTEYCSVYRSLLADEGLLSVLAEKGYILRFLLHPDISAQAVDFEECACDSVEIIAASQKGYEPYLKQAAVLITDYNGVQFDFAYMEKPIIYYHMDSLPPDDSSESFDYETEGFGPVVHDQEALISELSRILDENIVISDGPDPFIITQDETYLTRIDEFFAFRDRENRGRIYDVIAEEYGG